ncbi:MAG: ABC transporter ATP-binding protein [Thermodesulfobacteriota bacterium]
MLKELRPFAGHLRGRARALAALFALGLLGAAASLATPLLGKAFIDAVATRGDFGAVPRIAAALVALAAVDFALAGVTRVLHTRLSAELLAALRERLFARCLAAPLEHMERFRHGDLLTRYGTDVPRVQVLLVDGLLGAVQSVLFLAVAAAILFHLAPALALWSFAGVAAALALAAAFRRPVEARTQGVREVMADLAHFLSERLGALRPVRLHGAEGDEGGRLAGLNRRLTARVVGFQVFDALTSGLPGLSLTLSLAWIYVLGGRLLEAGSITLGTFVAFVLYQGRLFGPAQGLLGLVRSLQESRVHLGRVAELLGSDAGPGSSGGPEPEERGAHAAVEVRGVSFAYPGKPPALRGLDLRLGPGEKVALCGPSGAGKSTLVQLLFGLRRPSAGWVRVGGASPGDGADLRQIIGYAGAEPFLLHATVEENLTYGCPGADPAAVLRAARTAEAHEFILSLPEGYRTVIGGRGLALSDGQRQRLGIARLLVRAPPILVLDEAFSALDPDTEARVRRNLWREYPDRTVLLVTHRLGGLGEFDRLLRLRDGALQDVTEAELLGAPAAEAAQR